MTLRERINKIAAELGFDLRDAYTRILATAMAAKDADDDASRCGICGRQFRRGDTCVNYEQGRYHHPDCP